ncbi:TIGR04222 domain-containing membrane protein [Streptosporangium sp. NPDC051023]|uniref:TIGR04222 domain-containing membrane protein n=1 Tax=Streptosporangium sp. NPDC051023 TaxID=3155410 RepID=UPI00344B765D
MEVVLFVLALLILPVVGSTVVALRAERRRILSTGSYDGREPLGHYDLAYLSGESGRVTDTVLGLLARSKAIQVTPDGEVSRGVEGTPSSPDEIERIVFDALDTQGGSAHVVRLRSAITNDPAVRGLRDRLKGLGLLLSSDILAGKANGLWRRLFQALCLEGVLVALAIYLSGVTWSFSVAVLVGVAVSTYGFVHYNQLRHETEKGLSNAGHEALAAARGAHAQGYERSTAPEDSEIGVLVALYGLGELGNLVMSVGLRNDGVPRRRAGGSSLSFHVSADGFGIGFGTRDRE